MFKSTAISILLLLNACSATKNAGVVYHSYFDFSAVQRYSLYDRNSTFSESQSLLDSRRNAIEISIEHIMAEKEFRYSTPEQADIIVTYHVFNGHSADYSTYNKLINFCQHCLRASAWNTANNHSKLLRGSLIIDLVDPNKKRSVWRSIYPLNIKTKDNSAKRNDKIKQAVAAMLAQYPDTTNEKNN